MKKSLFTITEIKKIFELVVKGYSPETIFYILDIEYKNNIIMEDVNRVGSKILLALKIQDIKRRSSEGEFSYSEYLMISAQLQDQLRNFDDNFNTELCKRC